MINAAELRIGNKLWKDGIIVTIDARSIFDIWEKSDKYFPIVLSDEHLRRAGFVEYHDEYYDEIKSYRTEPMGIDFDIEMENKQIIRVNNLKAKMYVFQGTFYCDNETAFSAECKHVHQLQNIYFALTGKELNVQL